MNIEELIAHKAKIQSMLFEIEMQIQDYDSGFKYLFEKWKYNSQSYYLFLNEHPVNNLIDESQDGDNFVYTIYTNDTNYSKENNYTLLSDEEMDIKIADLKAKDKIFN